ncbi:MAG TPA: type III pantothenate kinase [Chryseosolibacter sp.]|nr:type III pantothenate kinase [Chryseosolibacter sp.]
MNLVVDSGNSAAKVGIFSDQKLTEKSTFSSAAELQQFMRDASFHNLIVSSVKSDAALIASWGSKAKKQFILTRELPLPVKNLYKTPETLGMDRIAGVCGAHQLFPSQNCLVIDAGTCITYDIIDQRGNYRGGSISPGLNMRFQALHTFTAKLPLVLPMPGVNLIGDTTETSIQSGVVNGLLAEINGIIGQYHEKFPHLNVILCGGDAVFFENQLKASIFASPELVLMGLNSILIYNVNHS